MIDPKDDIRNMPPRTNQPSGEMGINLPSAVSLSQEPLLRLHVATMRASTLASSVNEEKLVCSGDFSGPLSVYDLSDLGNPRKFAVQLEATLVRSATFLPNGNLLVATREDSLFALGRSDTGNFNTAFRIPVSVQSAPIVLGNNMFAVGGTDGFIYTFKALESRCDIVSRCKVAQGHVRLGRLGSDGLIAAEQHGSLYLWRGRAKPESPAIISAPRLASVIATGELNGACFAASSSSEGLLIYTCNASKEWSYESFSLGDRLVNSFCWLNPDTVAIELAGGPTVLVAEKSRSSWQIRELRGEDGVTRLCADGRGGLVTGGFHGQVTHWSRQNGEWQMRTLGSHQGMVSELLVNKEVGAISVGYDGNMFIWGRL